MGTPSMPRYCIRCDHVISDGVCLASCPETRLRSQPGRDVRWSLSPRAVVERLVSENAKLVYWTIGKIRPKWPAHLLKRVGAEAIESVGFEALLNAARKFDASLGYKFSTYATNAIFRNCTHLLTEEMKQQRERQFVEGSIEKLPDTRAGVEAQDAAEELQRVLEQLPPRERFVVEKYEELTDGELGELLGVSNSRVGQLRQQAMKRIRDPKPKRMTAARLNALAGLTDRQRTVLSMVYVEGQPTAAVAHQLGVAYKTVDNTRRQALAKMGWNGRASRLN